MPNTIKFVVRGSLALVVGLVLSDCGPTYFPGSYQSTARPRRSCGPRMRHSPAPSAGVGGGVPAGMTGGRVRMGGE